MMVQSLEHSSPGECENLEREGEREPWPQPISTALKQAGQQEGTGGLRGCVPGLWARSCQWGSLWCHCRHWNPPWTLRVSAELNWHSFWMVETFLAAVNWRDAKYHWKDTINFIAPWLFQTEQWKFPQKPILKGARFWFLGFYLVVWCIFLII